LNQIETEKTEESNREDNNKR